MQGCRDDCEDCANRITDSACHRDWPDRSAEFEAFDVQPDRTPSAASDEALERYQRDRPQVGLHLIDIHYT